MKNANESTHHAVLAFTLGDRLAKAMKVADISRGELAEYLGVSPTTIGNYTADRTPVKKQTLRLWALRTGVPLEWIETGDVSGSTDPDGDGPQKITEWLLASGNVTHANFGRGEQIAA